MLEAEGASWLEQEKRIEGERERKEYGSWRAALSVHRARAVTPEPLP